LAAFEKELRRFSSLGKHGSMVVDSQALEPGMAPRWGGVRCPPPALARPGPPHADPTLCAAANARAGCTPLHLALAARRWEAAAAIMRDPLPTARAWLAARAQAVLKAVTSVDEFNEALWSTEFEEASSVSRAETLQRDLEERTRALCDTWVLCSQLAARQVTLQQQQRAETARRAGRLKPPGWRNDYRRPGQVLQGLAKSDSQGLAEGGFADGGSPPSLMSSSSASGEALITLGLDDVADLADFGGESTEVLPDHRLLGEGAEVLGMWLCGRFAAGSFSDHDYRYRGVRPLHFAAAHDAPRGTMNALLRLGGAAAMQSGCEGPYAQGASITAHYNITTEYNGERFLPLHWAIQANACAETVQQLLHAASAGAGGHPLAGGARCTISIWGQRRHLTARELVSEAVDAPLN
jgi:hypothetical protein